MKNIAALLVTRTLRKVPEVTIYFWIVKLLTTAYGESTSDYLVNHINPIIAVAFGGLGFALAMIMQFSSRRYIAWVYWLAVAMVAIFGTMVADVIHIVLHVPYLISTIAFAIILAIVFTVWYVTEKTLSIHSIITPRRELFYWATVITTFALGTAAGDMTASTFHLGYFSSGILFVGLFALSALAYFLLGLNEIVAFWFAYILTRPIGASFADWTGRTVRNGGVGIGTDRVSIALLLLIIAFVAFLTVSRVDSKDEQQLVPGNEGFGVQQTRT